MTAPDVRTAAQAEAGARVLPVTVVRQEADSVKIVDQYYRVEPCLPTREQIAQAIAGEEEYPHPRGYLGHADAVLALMQELD